MLFFAKLIRPIAFGLALLALATAGAPAQTRPGKAPVTAAQQIFQNGVDALQAGDYVAAEQFFRRVLAAEPGNVGAIGNLGTVYSRTQRYSKAIAIYRHGLQLSPNDRGLLLNLGLIYLKQENYSQALPLFRRLHSRDRSDAKASQLLATCLVFSGNGRAALELLRPLAEKHPDPGVLYLLGVAYTRTGKVEQGKAIFSKLIASDATRPQTAFLLGQAYYDSGRFEEAEQSFQETLAQAPQFPGLHRELGKVYISQRKNPEAERELRLAVQQDAQDDTASYFLGALLVQTQRYAEGVPILEQVLQKEPSSWAANFYLGKAKLKLDDSKSAVHYLQQAAALNPDEPFVFYLLASALRSAGQLEASKAALRRVAELHGNKLDAEKRALQDAHVVGER